MRPGLVRYLAFIALVAAAGVVVVWTRDEPPRVDARGEAGGAAAGTSTVDPPGPGSPDASVPASTTTDGVSTGSSPTTLPDDGRAATQRSMSRVARITDGPLTPKSVVTSGDGLAVAQNMMYQHGVTVYDRSHRLVKRIDDRYEGLRGSPVEAAFTHDRRSIYVTNYQMYGDGYDKPGGDNCGKGAWDPSYVYRIDVESLEIDQRIEVGAVPKYVAVTPDDRAVLVTNWCGYDLSVIDAATGTQTRRVDLGRFPRGIAVTPDSSTAFVAVMGSSDIAAVDLSSFEVTWIRGVGRGPRHLVMSPDGASLYATLNSEGAVARIDVAERKVVAKLKGQSEPRSMAISDDGTALYVVNYSADRVAKIDTATMTETQRVPTDHHPIGISYDPGSREVWVACYSGSLLVFADA